MASVITHAAVRLYPEGPLGEGLRAVNLHTCVSYRCSKTAAMLLVAFMQGASVDRLCEELSAKYKIAADNLTAAIAKLRELGLIVSPNDASHVRTRDILSEWSRYGWVDAGDYHIATLNYPFADYAVDGREIDFQRMRLYADEQPDTDRTKIFPNPIERIVAPNSSEALKYLDSPFADVWLGGPDLEVLDKDRCAKLLSIVFGQMRTRKLSDSPDLIADAISKTSPSGGSRHPTECYLFSTSVIGLKSGVYHFNVANSSLDFLKNIELSSAGLMRLFSGPLRASFGIQAFIVMTSIFGRSMYRYREPRSFRAIYMDVGHICGTLDLTAKGLGLNCLVQHGLNDNALAEEIGLDTLFEGVIYGAALGGRSQSEVI